MLDSWFSRYSVGCYYYIYTLGFSQDLQYKTWALQFHASWLIKTSMGAD